MKLADLTNRAGEWLGGGGSMPDVVISSRIRLARNIAGVPFLSRSTPQQQEEIENRLREDVLSCGLEDVFYVDVNAAGEMDRQLLVERHLISRQHAQAKHPRGVAIGSNETVAVMVNEEDHLRLQVLRAGLQLDEAWELINHIDDQIEHRVPYAFHSRLGYLTACPTNVGTGMRVSVMLHLPALKMTGEIEKAFRAAVDLRLEIRGLFGEGTEATGDFFQISNQTTLGKSEGQILEDFRDNYVPQFVAYERKARESLMSRKRPAVDDKIFRAMAILESARLMSSEETMYLLSLARLGVNLGRVNTIDMPTINELFLLTQPAHLQKLTKKMSAQQRAKTRADYIRRRLEQGAGPGK